MTKPGHVRTIREQNRAIWRGIIHRCHYETCREYRWYGARGIAVCDRWRKSFDAFLEDMGGRPEGMSIERVDNDGNYEPTNCKWIPRTEQSHNQRSNKLLTFEGETLHIAGWARKVGLKRTTLEHRLKKGWAVRDALTVPLGSRPNKVRGQQHGNSKLTAELVLDIRDRVANGEKKRVIARSLGLSQTVIQDAVSGRRWGHV